MDQSVVRDDIVWTNTFGLQMKANMVITKVTKTIAYHIRAMDKLLGYNLHIKLSILIP